MRDFEQQWENNRKRLYGLLIYLTKDIDLAEDLLQEVYLRAGRKIATYHGGDFGAWLAAVARNIALAHLRKAYVGNEIPLDERFGDKAESDAGTDAHVEAIIVGKALDDLSPALRSALILKHYGGFNYTEIAARLNCPVGTAKRRVWDAIRQLRVVLGIPKEVEHMNKCPELALLDHAYGTLPEARRKDVEAHLAACQVCRARAEDIQSLIASLQAAREERIFVDITDMLADGSAITYSPSKPTNTTDQPILGWGFHSMKYHSWQSVFVNGKEQRFELRDDPDDPPYYLYTVHLEHPLQPGESAFCLGIYTTPAGIGASFDIGYDRRIAVPDNSGTDDADHLLVQMVRLPEGAKLIGAVPSADEVRERAKTTLIWRRLIPAGESRERPVVVYSMHES